MKVIIIGAGIGGLSTYHSLTKHLSPLCDSLTLKVYESHEPPEADAGTHGIGGALGLAPNGLRAISSLSPEAIAYIEARAYPGSTFTLRNSAGKLLCNLHIRKERYGFDQLMVRRSVVHEALLIGLPPDAITWNKAVESVKETEEGVEILFKDGSRETADLVIGADGAWSQVRSSLFGEQYKPFYEGWVGVGGFIPLHLLSPTFVASLKDEGVNMTFGSKGFFGYSLSTPYSSSTSDTDLDKHTLGWWSIYESPALPEPSERTSSHVRTFLLSQHKSWKSPYDTPSLGVYEELINLGCPPDMELPAETNGKENVRELMVLPRYQSPRMPSWTSQSGRIILIGDAAHTMPPDSGQGASCAVEDALMVGCLLGRFYTSEGNQKNGNTAEEETFKKVARAYESLRMGRVHKILDVAKRNGEGKKQTSWFGQKVRDFFFWVLSLLPQLIHDGAYMYKVEESVEQYKE